MCKEETNKIVAIIAALRSFIKKEAIKATGSFKASCVKQEVFACLIQTDGTLSFGTNAMAAAISLCPRVQLGISGYEPCADICHQGPEFHAERQAIWNAYYENDQLDLTGAEMFITGHILCCDTCRQAMFEEGIVYAGSLDSGRYYKRGGNTMEEVVRCRDCGLKQCACDDIEAYLAEIDRSDEVDF